MDEKKDSAPKRVPRIQIPLTEDEYEVVKKAVNLEAVELGGLANVVLTARRALFSRVKELTGTELDPA